ncbi:PAS domain S-box protein [bacterium]|nr:PAS domain S-box protein [bacterium]
MSSSSSGLTEQQKEYLCSNGIKMSDLKALFQPQFDRYRVGRSYYFPHDCIDPFIKSMRSVSIKSDLDIVELEDWHPADMLYFPLIGFNKKIIGLLSMDDPISGKKPTEQGLRLVELFVDAAVALLEEGEFEEYRGKTQGLLSRLFDLSPIMILLFDEKAKIIDLNNSAMRILGFEKEEILGCNECKIIASSDAYKKIISERELGLFSGEVLIAGKEKEIWGLLFSMPVYSNKGKIDGYISHITDITESKKLQQYLVRAEKLAGIGILASGIAHEINNPLYAILGIAENIETYEDLPNRARAELKELIEYTKEAGQILKDLSGYTYLAQRESEFPVNINEVIRKAVKLVDRSSDVIGVTFKLSLGEISDIKAYSSELMQVFVNLIINSLDAIPRENGIINITTFQEEKDIFCIIEDNGHGISEDILDSIFEPFYTTKQIGKGTGLGLYVCYKLVNKNRGIIEFKSEQGKGTKVFLKFQVDE